jgi:hypothetical protein
LIVLALLGGGVLLLAALSPRIHALSGVCLDVSGRVVDPNGAPIAGATVVAARHASSLDETDPLYRPMPSPAATCEPFPVTFVRTDAEGRFRLFHRSSVCRTLSWLEDVLDTQPDLSSPRPLGAIEVSVGEATRRWTHPHARVNPRGSSPAHRAYLVDVDYGDLVFTAAEAGPR